MEASNNKGHNTREGSKTADWAMVLLTLFTLIAAIVSAWLFQAQLVEARRSTDAAICNFLIDERGWIELDSMKVMSSGQQDRSRKVFQYAVYLKNVGKTVANTVNVRGTTIRASESMLKDSSYISSEQHKLMSVSGASVSRILAPNASTLAPLKFEVSEPKREQDTWNYDALLGRIDYDDVFGTQHWATFCYYFEKGGEVFTCVVGNDEDLNREVMPSPNGKDGKSCLGLLSTK